MVADGDYREDLLYRMNGYSIQLPALRDRGDDLTALIKHFLARIARELGRPTDGLAPEAFESLKAYRWPGNVRELEGVLRQTLLQANGTVIAARFLPAVITDSRPANDSVSQTPATPTQGGGLPHDLGQFIKERLTAGSSNTYAETLEMMERYLLYEILSRASGNQSEAARILGITRGSLRHRIRALGISIESQINAGE